LVGTVALLLSGCGPNPEIYVREGNSGPDFLVCDVSPAVTKLEVQRESDTSFEGVWTAEGKHLDLPTLITFGTPPVGWNTTFGPSLNPDEASWIRISLSNSSARYDVAEFQVDKLRRTEWLSLDGDYFSGDCPRAPQ
jgi:hypothetical protein